MAKSKTSKPATPLLNSTQIQKRTVSDYLNNEVKAFAKYVIRSRALPNIMDGLRTGARKIVYCALNTPEFKQGRKVKMLSFLGSALALQYKHGNVSLENTAAQLSALFTLNTPPLEIIGQKGSLRVPNSDTAPRYLHVRASKYLDMFRVDYDLLTPQIDEGEEIEPPFLLPIIPICMMQRTSNPGFGFSFKGFSYDVNDVIAAVIQSLTTGTCDGIDRFNIKPYINGIKPENMIWNDARQSWYNVGEFDLNFETDTMRVTDLPYNCTYEGYEELLNNLIDTYQIKDFKNYSEQGNIDYRIEFHKGRLKMMYNANKWKFFSKFKLYAKIPKLNLNCIDEDNERILFFETPNELIDTFVKKRLKYYTKRKTHTIELLEKRNQLLDERILFIQLVVDGKLTINNRPISEIKKDLASYNITTEVLKLPIARLTKDEIEKARKERKENQRELDYIRKTPEQEMYINDLISLEEQLGHVTDMSK